MLGAGKASARMAEACEGILGARIDSGLVITKYGHARPLSRVQVLEAGHPLPDAAGLRGARAMISLIKPSRPEDLILFLTSGGCSALLPAPTPPITLKEKQGLTALLLRSGAAIQEINTVRKHISQTKGGRLAKLAFPATVINLIISDVVGDSLDSIGSGPFVPDFSTFQEAWGVLDKYRLLKAAPRAIVYHLTAGIQRKAEETPKPGEPCFRKVHNFILARNRSALTAAAAQARAFGLTTLLLTSQAQGEARELAGFYGALAKEIHFSGHPVKPPACLIAGGEPTVTVRGNGLGGRNMELALAVAREIKGLPKTVVLSAGTDGTDGPTDAAGAIVNGRTWDRARKKGIPLEKRLENNDSYPFFKEAGGLVITGPTGTNVMDVHILLIS
ncbi:MAG TPA: glycerate kinase [Thermodesulfobacteriota bacterium]|nr:glycerate kinase [Thermodesulfobacteriota bacterium]